MSEYATIFGSPIAEVQNDLLLSYIIRHYPGDHPDLLVDFLPWLRTWRYCVVEAEYRGLLLLGGWAQWVKEAA
jgi:hypothetical protein